MSSVEPITKVTANAAGSGASSRQAFGDRLAAAQLECAVRYSRIVLGERRTTRLAKGSGRLVSSMGYSI